jgi:SAM-dependent methyltransferase
MAPAGTCAWCGGDWTPDRIEAREMMFGTRDAFTLLRCASCGSLAVAEPPVDLAPYYPPNYYSFESEPPAPGGAMRLGLGVASSVLLRMPPAAADRLLGRSRASLQILRALAGRGLGKSARVLDVGSGDGFQLAVLAAFGFRELLGVDPYLGEERRIGRVELRRAEIGEVEGSFDVIMANHVLEHLADPARALAEMRKRLSGGGTVIVRVPLADSWAASEYGADWVQLDTPRHLTVPTAAGVGHAAESAGLRLVRSFRDSTGFGYWASEQYRLDVPLRDERSWLEHPEASPLGRDDIARADALAREHNAAGDGDQGCFVLEAA